MGAIVLTASRPIAALLSPILMRQAAAVRRDVPGLAEAPGERTGVDGTGPVLRLLVVGESPAAGVGVDDQQQALPAQLAQHLAHRVGRRVEWTSVARTGMTASRAVRDLLPVIPPGPFHIAVVALGVNDTLKLRSRGAWVAAVRELAAGIARGSGCRIVLAGVPEFGGLVALPQPLRGVLALHARSLDRALAGLAGHSVTMTHVRSPRIDAEMLARDRFHPGPAGHAAWAHLLAEAIAKGPIDGI